MEPSETSGIVNFLIGITLMLAIFIIASIHLLGNIKLLPGLSPIALFGEALPPLIEDTIRVLYIGLMGWIASTETAKRLAELS